MIVTEVLKPVLFILNDTGMVTHTESDLISAVNMAIRIICTVRVDASTAVQMVILVDGALQDLPEGGLRLLDSCYRLQDERPVSPLKLISRSDLDRLDPLWITQPVGDVRELAYDERLPGQFWCVPPAEAGVKLQLLVSTLPEIISQLTDTVPLSDKYMPAIVEYVLYLMFSRDSENARNSNRAAGHLQTFFSLLGAKSQAEMQVSPNRTEG